MRNGTPKVHENMNFIPNLEHQNKTSVHLVAHTIAKINIMVGIGLPQFNKLNTSDGLQYKHRRYSFH